MSGTDYTLTPNLQLFKPIYDHDVEQWGAHLNSNADVLDAALSTGAGGVFLPIAGGAMAGNIVLPDGGNAISRTGADGRYLQLTGGTVSGAVTLNPASGSGIIAAQAGKNLQISMGGNATTFVLAGTGGTGNLLVATAGGASGNTIDLTNSAVMLKAGPITETSTFNGATHAPGVTNGFLQNLSIAGTNATSAISSINQWNVASDTLNKTSGQALFHSGIFYNFGGSTFAGNRGGLIVQMTQTGASSASSTSGGLEALHVGFRAGNSWGGTNLGTGAVGAPFSGLFYSAIGSGAVNMQGPRGVEIDIEAGTGSSYQNASGLSLITTLGHKQPGSLLSNSALIVAGQSNSIGWDIGVAFGGGWGFASTATLMRADWASDSPGNFAVARGLDLRPVTFSSDAVAIGSGFAIGSTGRVRVGTGYLDYSGTGISLDASGAVCTAGTLIGTPTTTYPCDGNFYYCDDPYGGIWQVTFPSGTSSITGITMVVAPVVKGAPPANPITLTPRGRLLSFSPAAITANLTWDASRTTLSLQPSGGATTFGGAVTMPSTLAAGASTFNGATTTSGTNTLSAGSAIGTNNIIRLNPAASGSHTSISVLGPDTNTYLNFSLQGSGYVQIPRLNMPAGTVTLSGTGIPEQTPLNIAAAYTGTATDNRNFNLLNITSDNGVVPTAASGLTITHNYGGAAMKGGRNALNVNLIQSAATQNTAAFYQATNFSATATQPDKNGSTPALGTGSAVFAIGAYATLNPTALGYGQLAGFEQDIIAGAQPYQIVGINTVRLSGGFGTLYQALEPSLDSAYRVGSSLNAANWVQGYTITGPSGQWAIDPVKGTLFKAFPGQGYSAFPPAALAGIDLSYVAFSGSAYHSQGAIIDGSGNASFKQLNLGNWAASVSSTGLTLDPGTRQVALTAAVSAGGTAYNTNEQFSFAGNGRGIVTAQSGGIVSAVTVLEYPTSTSPPANPVATTSLMFGGAGQATGSGLTLNLTWSPGTGLSLSPSGGAVSVNAGCTITSGSAAPASTQPAGSIYMRTGGASGARLYVSAGAGTWNAIAGV